MDSLNEIWSCVLSKMRESGEFTEPTYNLWFRDLELMKLTSHFALINTRTQLRKDIITSRYLDVLERYLEETIGFSPSITLEVYEDHEKYGKILLVDADADEQKRPAFEFDDMPEGPINIEGKKGDAGEIYMTYNPQYTFDNFVVGNSNKFAHAACRAIAADADHVYNPLFIYGDSGLGKTHLLYAITNEILEEREDCNVVYTKGEEFANELIKSISKKAPMEYFRERYRNADVLLVDDIQFIAGKPSTQEEFFHTFNALHEEKKQIILASDRPPRDIPNLEERLRTRFEWGLIVDVQPPDYELRLAILKNKAQALDLEIPENILIFLADNLKGSIRQLEGALKRLRATSLLTGTKITQESAKETLQDLFSNAVPIGITLEEIFEIVSRKYAVPVSEIKGRKRDKKISHARHVTIYIMRTITNMSLTEIGSRFGMHHTSVMSAYSKIVEDQKTDPSLEFEISSMIRELTGK